MEWSSADARDGDRDPWPGYLYGFHELTGRAGSATLGFTTTDNALRRGACPGYSVDWKVTVGLFGFATQGAPSAVNNDPAAVTATKAEGPVDDHDNNRSPDSGPALGVLAISIAEGILVERYRISIQLAQALLRTRAAAAGLSLLEAAQWLHTHDVLP